jgi:hypothetical protein
VKRRSRGVFLLVLFTLYMSVMSISRVVAQDQGEPIVGLDPGQQIEEPVESEDEGGSIWGWVLGIGAVVVAGVAGYLLAEDSNDEADDAATSAQASAASAEAAAADAAAAAPAAEQAFESSVHITGEFNADTGDYTRFGAGVAPVKPAIWFRLPYDNYTGGIWKYTQSSDGLPSPIGGSYEQVSDKSVLISVDDILYLGKATAISEDRIMLQNGLVLRAEPGAGIYVYKFPIAPATP